MAPASTFTKLDAIYKELYPDGVPENVALKSHPLLEMFPKMGGFTGDVSPTPTIYGHAGVRSATASTAYSSTSRSSQSIKWLLTRDGDYVGWSIGAEEIAASEGNEGAFIEARELEGNSALEALGDSLSHALYRSGSGSIGKVSAISSATITLVNASDTRWYDVDQVVQMDSVDGGGTVHTGTLTVQSVNEDDGQVTFTAAVTTGITSAAVNDFVFSNGDYDEKIKGLGAWIPSSTPTSTAFFGVDRTKHVTRLGGNRLPSTQTNDSIMENLNRAAARTQRHNGKPTLATLHPDRWVELENYLQSAGRVQYSTGKIAELGFQGIRVSSPAGVFDVISDPDCPPDGCWVLDLRVWKLRHLRGLPHIAREDGLEGLRTSGDDGVEYRARYWAQPVCMAPGKNCYFAISTS